MARKTPSVHPSAPPLKGKVQILSQKTESLKMLLPQLQSEVKA